MRRKFLSAGILVTALLAGCDESSGRRPEEPPLPMFFRLDGAASATADDLAVDCSLEFIVEVSGEVSRTDEVVEYIATMGGNAVRNFERPDGPSAGSRFWDELRFFDGFLKDDGSIEGEWLCAPLDVEQGGINDDTVFAEGNWETTEIVEERR